MSIFSVRWVQGWEETVTAGFGNLFLCWVGGLAGLVILISKHVLFCD